MDRASSNLQYYIQVSWRSATWQRCASWANENTAPLTCPSRLVAGFTLTRELLAHCWRLRTSETFIVSSDSLNDLIFLVSTVNVRVQC